MLDVMSLALPGLSTLRNRHPGVICLVPAQAKGRGVEAAKRPRLQEQGTKLATVYSVWKEHPWQAGLRKMKEAHKIRLEDGTELTANISCPVKCSRSSGGLPHGPDICFPLPE